MPNTKSESPYIFSTDEQLRQDLKKAMVERRYTANALARFFDVTPSTLGRFLEGSNPHPRKSTREKYIDWLSSGELPAADASAPIDAWLKLQTCLIDLAGRTGGLPPDVMSAITELNSFFSLAK